MTERWQYRIESVQRIGPQSQYSALAEQALSDWLIMLNNLGADGWELVSSVPFFSAGSDPAVASHGGTFKRRLE
jgi:hypothetical protein